MKLFQNIILRSLRTIKRAHIFNKKVCVFSSNKRKLKQYIELYGAYILKVYKNGKNINNFGGFIKAADNLWRKFIINR
jgi:hypothetical protein